MPRCLPAVFILLLAAAGGAWAQQPPTVGLVLGGGGARGGAHLGVIEVIEELRIPVKCIAGTSMGALVGGAYASGVSPQEILALVERTDWNEIFDDFAGRDAVDVRRKELDDRYFSGIEFGLSRRGLQFREGAVSGEKVKLLFNQLVRADLGDRPIEKLRLPLSIIATDIGSGERVAIRRGNLTSAMRASMSVPGLMSPVIREGRKLVDGGLTDNLPIAEVRALCNPDVVIAVNVGSPLYRPDEVTGVVSVLGQVVNLLTEQNVARSMSEVGKGDVYVRPDLGDLTAGSFTRMLEARVRGRLAMDAVRDELKRFSVSREAFASWQDNVRIADEMPSPVIDQVVVAATRFVNPETIRGGITQKEGQPLDAVRLGRDLLHEFNWGDLHSLDYNVERERDRTILRITPIEKPWGPDYLRFGLNFTSDFRSEASFNLRALVRRTWMNSLGGEWLVGAQIGGRQQVGTEFHQPLDRRHVSFVRASGSAGQFKVPVFINGDRIAIYRAQENAFTLEVGRNFGVVGQLRGGWMERRVGAVLDTGSPQLPNLTEQLGGLSATLVLDTWDHPFFPTRGFKVDATHFEALRVNGDADGSGKYSRAEVRSGVAMSFGDWVVLGGLDGGKALRGTLPLGDAFTLGGPRRLAGFATDQLRGGEYLLGRLEGQYRLNFGTPLLGVSLIAGVTAEAGRMRDSLTEPLLTSWQRSFGAYLAASTPIGPVYLGVADARNGKGRFYLFIGTP